MGSCMPGVLESDDVRPHWYGARAMEARILYVDDSGKPDAAHSSGAVVIAGFTIDAERYPTLSRRVLGAKGAFHPRRGAPQSWEIKSADLVRPNPWKRANNRKFVAELRRIVQELQGTMYSITITKNKMKHPMTLAATMPLLLQVLVEHFDAECRALGRVGMVVSDWSNHQYDQHASRCVASFVAASALAMHPGVYYASSHTTEGIQVADVIAAVRRRAQEGDVNMQVIDGGFRRVATMLAGAAATVKGHQYSNWLTLF